ncbi:MAG: hypothetical protein ACLP01_17145 [Solirubrobacteraceae bacterium]
MSDGCAGTRRRPPLAVPSRLLERRADAVLAERFAVTPAPRRPVSFAALRRQPPHEPGESGSSGAGSS